MEEQVGMGAGDDGGSALRAMASLLPGAVADQVVAAIQGSALSHSRSPQIGELVKALCRAKLKFGQVFKDREAVIPAKDGKTGYKYGYATLAAAGEAADQYLAEEELNIFYSLDDGPGWFSVTTELFHSSDQFNSCSVRFDLPRESIGPQGKGKLITFGRRYGKFCILDLAPTAEEDNDAGDIQGKYEGQGDSLSEDDLKKLAANDPQTAFLAVRKLVTAAGACGQLSEPRVNRLLAIAYKERGWSGAQVEAAAEGLLGVKGLQNLPWKVYETIVQLFQATPPAVLQPPKQAAEPQAQPSQVAAAQAAAEPTAAQPPPVWEEVWPKIKADYAALTKEAAEDVIDRKTKEAVIEGFARNGWTAAQISAVLRREIGIGVESLPKQGTEPPVFLKIARAFRVFRPETAPAIYGFAAPSDGTPTVAEILEAIPLPPAAGTADDLWRAIKQARDGIAQHHSDALVPITPEDRLLIFGNKGRNGNRSSGDVEALVGYYLGAPVAQMPSLLFPHVLGLLSEFPVEVSGREEVLGRLPINPAKIAFKSLGDLAHGLINDGLLKEEDVPRAAADGKSVDKSDLISTFDRLREKALMEARRT